MNSSRTGEAVLHRLRVMSFANISASLASLKVAIFVLKYTKSAPRVYGFSLMSVLTFVSQRSSSLSAEVHIICC